MTSWDHEVDLLIVGSGSAGMTAALTAKLEGLNPLIVEKAEHYGGSTAISGGGIWIPNNHLMEEAGIEDSLEKARTYMKHTVGERTPEANQEAFLKHAPKMIQYISKLPHMKFQTTPGLSDYHPERPGGLTHGRGIETPIFAGAKLGSTFKEQRPIPICAPFGILVTIPEVRKISLAMTNPSHLIDLFKIFTRNLFAIVFRRKHFGLGSGLTARLRMSLKEQDVPVWLSTPVREIIFENGSSLGAEGSSPGAKGSAIGVEVERDGKKIRIRAKKGVVLAAGGFPHNYAMRKKYQKHPVSTEWTLASPDNTGDLIQMGIDAGAAVDLMDDSWGMPTLLAGDVPSFPLLADRSYPGSIVVNARGRRFTNEAASYVDFVHAMYDEDAEGELSIPSFMVMDQRFRSRYFLGPLFPGQTPRKYLESGYIRKADTIEALAEKTGVDPSGLMETVRKFNEFARKGKDLDFGRGESDYDCYYGDPSVKPNRCLAPIEKPPFYAVKVHPGDLGTKGGLLTNEKAQVLRENGEVIQGLYAAGNTSASVMGHSYPGAGATIGPAMTFGYIAALHAAGSLK
ncbi:MAG: FAD-binding protein [Deltaproteobacteria bacterium]|nr:FAD-binding protein [Deltaproteobacteria bacterium]